jgi:hypothetical protein
VTSFREQMRVHEASREATSALEAVSRAKIQQIFTDWENGQLTNQSVRWALEAVIRDAYRSSALVSRQVAQQSSGLQDWDSAWVFNNEYLQSLIQDVRRNLRDYKSGTLSRAGAISRIQHSAGVAAQRGYTDQAIASYTELEDFGLQLRKYWVANFKNNTPCPYCTKLHGTHVGLHEMFSVETGEPGVYRDLIGPPRHPNCKCRLFIFTITLDNAFESPDFEQPQSAPEMMSTDDVKKMPLNIFGAVRASLSAILSFLRRRR